MKELEGNMKIIGEKHKLQKFEIDEDVFIIWV